MAIKKGSTSLTSLASDIKQGSINVEKVMKGTTPLYLKVKNGHFSALAHNGTDSIKYKIWNDNDFEVDADVYVDGSFHTTLSIPANNDTSYQYVNGLNPDTWYTLKYKLKSVDTGDEATYYEESVKTSITVVLAPTFHTCQGINSDTIEIRVNNPNNFTLRVWFDYNDSTPDLSYEDVPANSTSGSIYINGLNPATNYTIYIQGFDGNNNPSSVNSDTATTAASDYYWNYITTHSSEPTGEDRYVSDNYGGDIVNAADDLQASYPASNESIGNIGVAYCQDYYVWFEFEVQEV